MIRAACVTAALLLLLGVTGCNQPPQSNEPAPAQTTPPAASEDASGAPTGWGPADSWIVPAAAGVDPSDFVEGVDNAFWPLSPGTRWIYEATTDEGPERIEIVVRPEKREVMGIQCVVVRDTVTSDGELVEDTFDWYAQDRDGNVWYMGEDVKNYENGQLVDTEGSWEAGVNGAQPGIKIWASPTIGGTPYFQELYQGQAEDLARDIALDGTASVPFGDFEGLLVIEEWTPLDPDVVERKYYAGGIGTVKEEMTRGGTEVVELIEFSK